MKPYHMQHFSSTDRIHIGAFYQLRHNYELNAFKMLPQRLLISLSVCRKHDMHLHGNDYF